MYGDGKQLVMFGPEPHRPEPKQRSRRVHSLNVRREERIRTVQSVIDLPIDEEHDPAIQRPRTRGECYQMPRPCPYVGCRHHVYLDVDHESGTIKFNYGELEPWELQETCSLDVADDRVVRTFAEVGEIMNVTGQRVQQVETRAQIKMAAELRRLMRKEISESG